MQVFTSQLSAPSEGRVPSHYKELGQLIRQLSLCSAKVEVGQGSAVPETALDILQKLEVRNRSTRSRLPQLSHTTQGWGGVSFYCSYKGLGIKSYIWFYTCSSDTHTVFVCFLRYQTCSLFPALVCVS